MKALKLTGLLMISAMGVQPILAQEATNAAPAEVKPPMSAPAQTNGAAQANPSQAEAPAPAPMETTTTVSSNAAPMAATNAKGEKLLRLNFHGVPLSMVLTYLSDAAGLIIVLETEVTGKVDVWSQQPLTVDESVNLLNSILNKNGFAAIRNGRTLTIVSRADAKTRDIPVKIGSNPAEIPKNDEMVTQIIPVRYANAVQMVKDLQPLLPTYASLSANESGNALVLTDVQTDIRRIAQIVKALDTSISSISTVKVFPLRYADSKELATEVKELFPTQNATGNNGGNNNPMAMFPGFGGRNRQGNTQNASTSEARTAAGRVTAVADERTNSLVVSAPDDAMPVIEQLVKEIDTNAENITELRVFRLKNADPVEMADQLTSLFPDESKSDNTRSSIQFGRGGFMGGGAATQTSTTSTRAKQMNRVLAVPDQRTASVIVTAASDLMPQISEMIEQLDTNPAKKQKVFVYSLENADVDNVVGVLQDMFQSSNSRGSSSSSRQNNNALSTRQTQSSQSTSTSTTGNNRSSGGGFGN
jgi:type II secretory pathway component GspD/PulD (secretin)